MSTPSQVASQPPEAVTVLLVSPVNEHSTSLRHILEQPNWKVRQARNCREALELLRDNRVPVVICERQLPDGNWQFLLDEIERSPHPANLIVSSRLADNRLWAEVLNLGGYDVLVTPFEAGEVFRVAYLAWESWKRESERNEGLQGSPRAVQQVA